MNCKNCRVKGCWSRGMPRGSQYYKKSIETVDPQPRMRKRPAGAM